MLPRPCAHDVADGALSAARRAQWIVERTRLVWRPTAFMSLYRGFMLVMAGESRVLGDAAQPRVRFAEAAKAEGAWRGRRVLTVGDVPTFELSFWCGTCQDAVLC